MIFLRIRMKKAFTFVELLVVIAIMGILTVIAVSQFQGAKRKASDVSRKGDLNGVGKALTMYFADYGKFPEASVNGKIVLNGNEIDWGTEFVDNGYVYSKILPKENKNDFPQFCYKTDASRKAYALFARLENDRDLQCDRNDDGKVDGDDMVYLCGGKTYCFAITSPNFDLDNSGTIIIPVISIPVLPTSTPVPPTPISSKVTPIPCTPVGRYCDFTVKCCDGVSCISNICGGGSSI